MKVELIIPIETPVTAEERDYGNSGLTFYNTVNVSIKHKQILYLSVFPTRL